MVVGDIPKQNENARRPTPNDDSEDWYTVIYELELKVRHTVDLTGMRNTRQLGASTNVPNKREEMSHYTTGCGNRRASNSSPRISYRINGLGPLTRGGAEEAEHSWRPLQ